MFIDKVKELRNINQKLNGWLLAEARTSSESSTWKFLRASNSQRTQNRAEETNSPRSNQHRPQKVVTTSHRLMHSSLPIYTASSEFSCTVANHFLGCGPWEHFPTGAYTPQMLWRVTSLAPLLLHLGRIQRQELCWESSHMHDHTRKKETSVVIPLVWTGSPCKFSHSVAVAEVLHCFCQQRRERTQGCWLQMCWKP